MDFNYRKNYDIAVAGAGIAGVAAALAAARRGHKVALIERQTLIGGLATSGLIYIYLPICDGRGTQTTFGIAEELLLASLEFSPFDVSEKFGGIPGGNATRLNRYAVDFSPAGMILSLDDLLAKAGVDLWLESRICAVQQGSDGKVTALEVENSSGRGIVTASYFVDATGGADLVRFAGGRIFQEPNRQALWLMERVPGENLHYHFTDNIRIKAFGTSDSPDVIDADANNSKAVTDFTRTSWAIARKYYRDHYAAGETNRYNHYPLHLPAMAQFRKIARIDGIETLADNSEWQHYDSSVGLYGDWRQAGKVYETPYGTLIPKDVYGVLAAGRCISASGDAWESYRVIPSAAMTGEVAGTAAALAVEKGKESRDLSVDSVRDELRKNNFKFHFEELSLEPPRQTD